MVIMGERPASIGTRAMPEAMSGVTIGEMSMPGVGIMPTAANAGASQSPEFASKDICVC